MHHCDEAFVKLLGAGVCWASCFITVVLYLEGARPHLRGEICVLKAASGYKKGQKSGSVEQWLHQCHCQEWIFCKRGLWGRQAHITSFSICSRSMVAGRVPNVSRVVEVAARMMDWTELEGVVHNRAALHRAVTVTHVASQGVGSTKPHSMLSSSTFCVGAKERANSCMRPQMARQNIMCGCSKVADTTGQALVVSRVVVLLINHVRMDNVEHNANLP